MGRLRSFELLFDNNKTVYHPGDTVSGTCNVELKGDMRMRALRICMKGIAKVHWSESRTGTRLGNYTEHFNSEVEYFSKCQTLFGTEVGDGRQNVLEEGSYQFVFSFNLPVDGIATSFEGKHGSIRYWLKAEMEKPWTFNHKTKKFFTVISPIDINKPAYKVPVENNMEKTLCCWLCTSGPVTISARTDRRGYCPGESIGISAEFENHSSRSIVPYATLHQTQTFYANGKSRVRETKYTALTGLPIVRGTVGSWDAQLLKIPAVSPTILNCCLIRVEYYVKVALHIPGAYNVHLYLPIVVGTVPFRHPHHRVHPPYSPSVVPPPPYSEVGTSSPRANRPTTLYDEPPTYAESCAGAVHIRDEEDEDNPTTYVPMYVYNYNYRSPPPYVEIDPNVSLNSLDVSLDSEHVV